MYKVFISSTGKDLTEYRQAAIDVCRELGLCVIVMEDFEAMGKGATAGSTAKLREAQVYVGIFAHRYGYIEDGNDKSVTEMEFEYAGELEMERLCFLIDVQHPWPPIHTDYENYKRLEAFKARIERQLIRAQFTTVDDFKLKLHRALEAWRCKHEGEPDLRSLDTKWLKSHLQHVQEAFVDHLRSGEELTPEQADGRYLKLLVQVRRNEKRLPSEDRQPDDDKPEPQVGPVGDFLQHDCVGVLVFGEGGTGKTTSILKLAADAARRALTDAKQPIPFYIKLNLFDSREHGIERLLTLFSNASHLERENMEALWRTGSRPCIFFMDGFNEVKPDCQEACALALQEFMHPGIHRYVVTSRLNAQIAGLPAQVADTVTLDIVQLDEYQIRDFLIRHGAAGLYDQMDYGLKGLARNPFLLWVMAQSCAGLATKDLPRNRGQLYCNLIDHYIFAEREQKKIPPTTQYNFLLVKKPILSRLAFGMKQEGITRRLEDLTLLHTVRAQLREIRTQYDGLMPIRPHELMPDPPLAKAILDEMVTNNVLVRVGDAVEFMHESVQEYFAAVHLSSLGVEHLEVRECMRYDSWDEAIVLLAGLLDEAGALIELLAPLDPFLAVQCARQSQRVGRAGLEALQAQLNLKLASRYESERRNAQNAQEELTALMRPPVVLPVEVSRFYEELRCDAQKQQAEHNLRQTHYLVPPPELIAELIAELKTRDVTHLVQLFVPDGAQIRSPTNLAAKEVLRSLPMERVIPALAERLRGPKPDIGWLRVVELMRQLPSASILSHMLPLLVDQDAAVREAAVDILEALKDKSAIPHLIPLLEDANPRVRRRVVRALGALQAEHVVPLLFPLLRDKEPIPRLETTWGVFDELIEYTKGENVPRVAAAEVLKNLVTEKHLALLSPVLLDDDPDVYNAAFDIFQAVRRRLHLPKGLSITVGTAVTRPRTDP